MKKQIKKLSLNKKTISNLSAAEMEKYGGGPITKGKKYTCDRTCFNQRTCPYCW
jgi:natural product precursor